MKKIYYRIQFKLCSAMNIGSGLNDYTDKDLLKNSLGIPYIPGSTLAGKYRSLFTDRQQELYFGEKLGGKQEESQIQQLNDKNSKDDEENKKDSKENKESRVLVYDANLIAEDIKKFRIMKRDGVGLDEYKTAIKGAKFNYEILEPNVSFVTYIEQNIGEKEWADSDWIDVGERIVQSWLSDEFLIGFKTTRGMGKTKLEQVHRIIFDLEDKQESEYRQKPWNNIEIYNLQRWLDFDMYKNEQQESPIWFPVSIDKEKRKKSQYDENVIHIKLYLKQKGGISIRQYTTAVNQKEDMQPDYEQIVYTRMEGNEKKTYPVIPGTSWAGAFRHHMEKITEQYISDTKLDKRDIREIFGGIESRSKAKSKISFSESMLEGSEGKCITRNAIDRFISGTINGALYTEKTYFGGKTTLDIHLERQVCERLKRILVAAIVDLHMGFMAVGGLTSVGRGLFQLTGIEIDGQKLMEKLTISESELYEAITNTIIKEKNNGQSNVQEE